MDENLRKDSNNNELVENKMGVMPVNKLLINMSLPMMISMLVQAMYNIVDSIFVAQINEGALTAVSLAFPVQTLMIALLGGTCVGLNAVLSRSLGEKNFEHVNECARNGVFLAFVIYIILALVGIFGTDLFYGTQTTDVEILQYGHDYLSIVLIGSIGLCFQFTFEKLLQSTGKTFYSMITQGVGAIINIILDPIFIFGLFGLPAMGVKGAAAATICGQIIAALLGIFMNHKYNHEIEFHFKGFKPSGRIIKQIYSIGIPSIIMQSIGSIMVFGMNQILIGFSTTATAVFGVYYKLQSFIFMPVFGLNNGLVPIIAYNYGARRKDRLMKAVNLSRCYAMSIMALGFMVFQIIPKQLCLLFDASDFMLSMSVPALRIISISFIIAGFNIISVTMYQALGNAVWSMIISICRQLVVLLPSAYILSLFGNVNLVWWSFPIAEIFALGMIMFCNKKIKKDVLDKI